MERTGDGKETVGESQFPFRMRYTSLLESLGRLELSKTQVQTMETSGSSDNNNASGAIDETDCDLAIVGKMAVGFLNVLVDDAER